jgi:hypothetical protein
MYQNAQDMVNAVRDKVMIYDESRLRSGWKEQTIEFVESPKILPLLNSALNTVITEGKFNVYEFTTDLVVGQGVYICNKEFTNVQAMWMTQEGKYFQIDNTTEQHLGHYYGDEKWRSKQGKPLVVFYRGSTSFVVHPIPSADCYKLHFIAHAAIKPMMVQTDIPGQIEKSTGEIVLALDNTKETCLPSEYHNAVVFGACMELFAGFQQWESYNHHKAEFNRMIGEIRSTAEARAYGQIHPAMLSSQRIPHFQGFSWK